MWKIHNIIVCITCTVFGVLFFPLVLVFGVLIVLLTGLLLFYGLPLSVHVASIRLRIESFFSSAVDSFNHSSQTLLAHRRQLHSNGVLGSHGIYQPTKATTSPNLILRNKLSKDQEIPDSFTMPLNNCNLHSTPLVTSKCEPLKHNKKHYSFKDQRKSSWCDEKVDATFSSEPSITRNIQTVAGPLLASTRFNTFINAELAADVSSLGFSSRVAQRGNSRDGVTHQSKYSGVGVFPIVQFNSRSPKHVFSPRNNSSASKAVRVRIAPPDNGPFGGLENTILSGGSGGDDSMKSVLQVLKEMSRKRIHSQVDEEDDEKVKRQKKENCEENTPKTYLDGGLQNKRGRDDSPRSTEEVKRQRRQMNTSATGSNEITSSLSSSIAVKPPHLIKGTKRKAHVADWSRSTTPVSGKLLKVNSSPTMQTTPKTPVTSPDKSADGEKQSVDMELSTSNKSIEETSGKSVSSSKTIPVERHIPSGDVLNSSDRVRIEAGQRRVLARSGNVKEVEVQDAKWQDVITTGADDSTTCATISLKKIKDPGKRLKDMLAAIDGSDELDADPSSMSPSVVAILKTAKTSSKLKKPDTASSRLNDQLYMPVKSPTSILKTAGAYESHKSVTFSDRIEINAAQNQEDSVTQSNSSPQTCLTTATVVSNSINTSISSSSEVSPLGFSSFSTFNNDSSSRSPNLTFTVSTPIAVVTSATPTSSIVQPSVQSPSNVSVCATSDGSVPATLSGVAAASPNPNQSLAFTPSAPIVETTKNTGFAFPISPAFNAGVKIPDSTQPATPSPQSSIDVGIFGSKSNSLKETNPTSTVSPFSSSVPAASAVNSVSSSVTVKPGSLNFNYAQASTVSEAPLSQSTNTGKTLDIKQPIESSDKTQFSGFNFGKVNDPESSNKTSVSFFGGLNSAQSSTTSNSFQTNAPAFTAGAAPINSSAMFSFGSNAAAASAATPAANPAPSIFSSVTSTQPQAVFGSPQMSSAKQLPKTGFTVSSTSNALQPPNFNATVTGQSGFLPVSTGSGPVSQSGTFSNLQPNVLSATASTFGSSNLFSGVTANKADGFGSSSAFEPSPFSSVSTAPSLFNNFITPSSQTSKFGAGTSTVSNTLSSSTPLVPNTSVFSSGQTTTTPSLFAFGASAVTTQSSVFGGGVNTVSPQLPAANGPSSFSSFAGAQGEGDKAKQQPFGNSSFQTPNFSFGSSTPSSTAFAFGNSANSASTSTPSSVFSSPFKPPEQKPFGFDSGQSSVQGQATNVFGFGQNNNAQPASTASSSAFVASASVQPATSGVFSFGAATNTANASAFGSGINPPAFNIGSGAVSNTGSTMFNIGSGNSGARARAVSSRPRRK